MKRCSDEACSSSGLEACGSCGLDACSDEAFSSYGLDALVDLMLTALDNAITASDWPMNPMPLTPMPLSPIPLAPLILAPPPQCRGERHGGGEDAGSLA